jgi:2-polyprenyl-6-hydroxyphenyl methylase/3-demethylubiquinone-9 3-methyltransferase
MPAGPPPRLHDPALFVDRARLRELCARHGVPALRLQGLRPSAGHYLLWLLRWRSDVPMVATRVTAGLFQAWGDKQ